MPNIKTDHIIEEDIKGEKMIIKLTTATTQGLTYSVVKSGGQGEVVDLSAITAKIMVKKSVYDPDSKALILKELVHPESNLLYFELTVDDTKKLSAGKYPIALKLIYDSGAEVVLREDTLLVSKGVFDV